MPTTYTIGQMNDETIECLMVLFCSVLLKENLVY